MAQRGDGAGKGIFPKGEVGGSPDDTSTQMDSPPGKNVIQHRSKSHCGQLKADLTPAQRLPDT